MRYELPLIATSTCKRRTPAPRLALYTLYKRILCYTEKAPNTWPRQVHTEEVCFARVYRVGVWFGFVRSALLLAVVACIVLSFEAMPCLCCFFRVTHKTGNTYYQHKRPPIGTTHRQSTGHHRILCQTHTVSKLWLVSQGCIGVLGNAAAFGDGAEIDCCDVPPEWADHLTSAEFAFRCWLCSASADVMMEHMVVTKE